MSAEPPAPPTEPLAAPVAKGGEVAGAGGTATAFDGAGAGAAESEPAPELLDDDRDAAAAGVPTVAPAGSPGAARARSVAASRISPRSPTGAFGAAADTPPPALPDSSVAVAVWLSDVRLLERTNPERPSA